MRRSGTRRAARGARSLLLFLGLAMTSGALAFDPVLPGFTMQFPRDMGAHPGHRLEWWYVTGQLDAADGSGPLGFQVTFFRVRNPDAEDRPGTFSPRQLLFAHAALADKSIGHLLHDQRSARAIEGLVEARAGDTDVRIDDWMLRREGRGYRARIPAESFVLDLAFEPTQSPLPQGEGGFSRKGPGARNASYYYSEPQLRVTGRVSAKDRTREVTGTAWLDHEWSSEYLAAGASGWDWLGANLDDGGALMAFRIRGTDGGTFWAAGTSRSKDGTARYFTGDAVRFSPRRTWRSPRSGTSYPVEMEVRIGDGVWMLEPLMDDQELDARTSTGTLYWEGAVRLSGSGGTGRGYLELTGYSGRVPF
jgi:predicted secreted hydrolase